VFFFPPKYQWPNIFSPHFFADVLAQNSSSTLPVVIPGMRSDAPSPWTRFDDDLLQWMCRDAAAELTSSAEYDSFLNCVPRSEWFIADGAQEIVDALNNGSATFGISGSLTFPVDMNDSYAGSFDSIQPGYGSQGDVEYTISMGKGTSGTPVFDTLTAAMIASASAGNDSAILKWESDNLVETMGVNKNYQILVDRYAVAVEIFLSTSGRSMIADFIESLQCELLQYPGIRNGVSCSSCWTPRYH